MPSWPLCVRLPFLDSTRWHWWRDPTGPPWSLLMEKRTRPPCRKVCLLSSCSDCLSLFGTLCAGFTYVFNDGRGRDKGHAKGKVGSGTSGWDDSQFNQLRVEGSGEVKMKLSKSLPVPSQDNSEVWNLSCHVTCMWPACDCNVADFQEAAMYSVSGEPGTVLCRLPWEGVGHSTADPASPHWNTWTPPTRKWLTHTCTADNRIYQYGMWWGFLCWSCDRHVTCAQVSVASPGRKSALNMLCDLLSNLFESSQ